MPALEVADKPAPHFPKHVYHGIPVGRNIKPIGTCCLHHYVGPAATLAKGVGVSILTPEHLWTTFQKEAENVIKLNGKLIADHAERNRRINAAYAKLWLADNRFQWAGLAAFASKQVGCGMLHARRLVQKSRDEIQVAMHSAGSSTEAAGMSALPTMVRNGADYMDERLGFGNMHLFLDVYPLHRFYMERGMEEMLNHLQSRRSIAGQVLWNAGQRLEFGVPFEEIRRGFDLIEKRDLLASVGILARHEQVNILQAILYDDPHMQAALAANQLAWALRFPSGAYTEIQLTLSAQCRARHGLTSFFSRLHNAKLWVVEQRMEFVLQAATRFDELLRSSQRPYIEQSLRTIAAGQGRT